MVAKILPADPPCPLPLTLGMGSISQNKTILEYGHVAYQIEGNHEMQQHGSTYLAQRHLPPPTLGMKSIGQIQLFQNMVMQNIKLKRNTNAAASL